MSGTGRRQAGFTLVELMVAVALGLFVVAVGLATAAAHLRELKQLSIEARLTQDLRAASDLIGRTVRRAGHWHLAADALGTGAPNPRSDWSVGPQSLAFVHDRGNDALPLAFRLRDGVVETRIGLAGWQALTDASTSRVTQLQFTPQVQVVSLGELCTRPCPADSADHCPPRVESRSIELLLVAQSTARPEVRRRMQSTVHLRNDRVVGACAT